VIDRIRDMERRGAANLLGRLIETYIGSSSRLIEDAGLAFEAGRSDRLRIAMHTLKSASASLGALDLARGCGAIEEQVRTAVVPPPAAELEWIRVRRQYDQVVCALRALAAATPRGVEAAAGAASATRSVPLRRLRSPR
jgi:HPt (histidine-containing phosphotransfer) domain-containing protein